MDHDQLHFVELFRVFITCDSFYFVNHTWTDLKSKHSIVVMSVIAISFQRDILTEQCWLFDFIDSHTFEYLTSLLTLWGDVDSRCLIDALHWLVFL